MVEQGWVRYVFVIFSLLLVIVGANPVNSESLLVTTATVVPDAQGNPPDALPAVKSLDRQFDPIVVQGNLLEYLHAFDIKKLRLFAWSAENRFEVIPFQVDERDPTGEYVFTGGRLAGEDYDKGLLDHNDELVFMASDTGRQAPEAIWVGKGHRGVEIVVTDPVDTSKKGWVYFIYFCETPPPLSEKDYVHYHPEEDVVQTEYYRLGYREKTPLYSDVSIPKEVGGSGEDFFDRIKVRINVKTFFNLVSISKTEEDFLAETVGWKDGPLRVLRDIETRFRILFNLSSPSLSSVSEYYCHYMYIPLKVTIPFNLKWVFNSFGISDWTWHFYGDLPGMKGGAFYSNRNLQGETSTGHHPLKFMEENLDVTNIVWAFVTKEGVGTWFPRLVLPDILYQSFRLHIIDNEAYLDPPEDIPGLIGGGVEIRWKGVNEDLWFLLSRGTYELCVDSYFPRPGIRVEEVGEWLNIRDFPLWVDIARVWEGMMVTMTPAGGQATGTRAVERDPAGAADQGFCGLLTDVRGRQFSLDQIFYHVGSSRVTPRTFVLGETMADEKFHRPEFQEIRRIEHRLEEVDPVSGIIRPMFQKVIKRDGKILDLMSCKPCGFSGRLADGKKIFFWNTQILSVDLEQCSNDPAGGNL